ncbi:hypothetical protein QW060_08235 [Myroides ceti]|uniref:Uncharacterized protein n=1 Tax=Paenimyroides ceti TaxID=395087 RepID=A0ABT8CVB1_9FLAO|nr:hypothetical protein [Paenimyroides ceti]MDN3707122.1 hypothetical protein [Paenimyroides ceti]
MTNFFYPFHKKIRCRPDLCWNFFALRNFYKKPIAYNMIATLKFELSSYCSFA